MRKVSGRKTTLSAIKLSEALAFVESNHSQGLASPGKNAEALGLLLNEELLAVAIFCNPRTKGMQARYTRELFRMAFKKDVRVQGGASKLIKAYLAKDPWDLFTYQDTSGESTEVYSHAGMTLVQDAKPKQVLVCQGLTYATASNNRKDWFSIEQAVTNGPDRLLGTSLGEVAKKDGGRKSNIDLFIEDCGYHLETITGDRIYDWHNPNISFYTYRITNQVTKEYYIGRRTIKVKHPTFEECLSDGYMGSGGIEYKVWLKENRTSLTKEILGVYSTWQDVIREEKKAIGDKHLTDPLCVNLLPGGVGNIRNSFKDIERNCPTHGVTIHRGKSCMTCAANKGHTELDCSIHGAGYYRGGVCMRCASAKRLSRGECPLHGATQFQDNKCGKCTAIAQFSVKECEVHGAVAHKGDACTFCSSQKAFHTKVCAVHGETIHQGTRCVRCENNSKISVRECGVHGLVKHRGETCSVCTANSHQNVRECAIHGLVNHQNSSCTFCVAQKAFSLKNCSIHGEVNHQGERCLKCKSKSQFALKECTVHGLVKHRGASCGMCAAAKRAATLRKRKLEPSK